MVNGAKKIKFLLCGLILFHLVGNIIFLNNNMMPEGKDSYAHITAYLNFSGIFNSGQDNPFYQPQMSWMKNLIFVVYDYPPGFYIIAFIVNILIGAWVGGGVLFTSTLFFVMLILAVYKIGREVDLQTGILAAFICSFYPFIFSCSRHFNIEIALTAMVSVAVFLLIKTKKFTDTFFAIFLGFSLGIGLLIKQTFVIYLMGPFLIVTLFPFKDPDKKILKNMGMCLLAAALVGGGFYLNRTVLANAFSRMNFLGAVSESNLFSLEHLLYYPQVLVKVLNPFFAGAFVLSLFFIRRTSMDVLRILLAWIVVSVLGLSCFVLKYAEYTLAFLPAAAIITAIGINNIKGKKMRIVAMSVIVIFALSNYFLINLTKKTTFPGNYHPTFNLIEDIEAEQPEYAFPWVGKENSVIGIFYDELDLNSPSYLVRKSSVTKGGKGQFVDFMFRTIAFLENFNNFDYIVFVSQNDNTWMQERDFEFLFSEVNETHHTKIILEDSLPGNGISMRDNIHISKSLIAKFIATRNDFILEKQLRLFEPERESLELISFYRRKQL